MATDLPNRKSGSNTFITVVVVVAMLYLAREVFIPIALAILLTMRELAGRDGASFPPAFDDSASNDYF